MPTTKYNPQLMLLDLVDRVVEQDKGHIVANIMISPDEEYLRDHFPDFPIMPGVLMLESMVQAASLMICHSEHGKGCDRFVLGEVKAVKYGAMVKPGDTLRVEVDLMKPLNDGSFSCKGKGTVIGGACGEEQTAVAGRFTMRPARLT